MEIPVTAAGVAERRRSPENANDASPFFRDDDASDYVWLRGVKLNLLCVTYAPDPRWECIWGIGGDIWLVTVIWDNDAR